MRQSVAVVADNSFPDGRYRLRIEYESVRHHDLPHVVKFSGGRSSGFMLISMLEAGLLDSGRGDVVVFNNTSAEHPATYEFVRKCTDYSENKCGIPFYWIEYATYEDVSKGEWSRHPTFRIVNKEPYGNENSSGYHCKGEVFEEMVSQHGFVPSRHTRICTAQLKLATTYKFLSEWFAVKDSTLRRGHFDNVALMSDEAVIDRHRRSRGAMQEDELLRKKEFVRSRNFTREAQNFNDFSNIGTQHLYETPMAECSLGDFAPMKGDSAVEFVSLLGLRSDEPARVARVRERNYVDVNDPVRSNAFMSDGEIVALPLADSNITKSEILEFWESSPWDLELPDDRNLSNCVYCFMKGSNAIGRIMRDMDSIDAQLPLELRSVSGTPSDINWWMRLEEKYERHPAKRSADADANDEKVTIGFWGVDADETYRTIGNTKNQDVIDSASVDAQPCDCTD